MYKETIPWEVNYDAAEMPVYTLPDVLTCQDGTVVKTVEDWEKKRRPELLQMFKGIYKLTQKQENNFQKVQKVNSYSLVLQKKHSH